MIVALKRGASPEKEAQLIDWLKGMGLGVHISRGEFQTVLGLIGDTGGVDMDLVASLDIVETVSRVTETFKCCNRKFHPDDTVVEVGDVKIGGGNFHCPRARKRCLPGRRHLPGGRFRASPNRR